MLCLGDTYRWPHRLPPSVSGSTRCALVPRDLGRRGGFRDVAARYPATLIALFTVR